MPGVDSIDSSTSWRWPGCDWATLPVGKQAENYKYTAAAAALAACTGIRMTALAWLSARPWRQAWIV